MERSRNIKLITRGFLWRSKTVHHLFIYPSIHSLIHSFIKHKLRAYSVPRRDVSTSMMAIILSRFYSQTPQYSSGQRTEVHVSSSVVFPFTFHRPQNLFFFFKILFIHSWETQRDRERGRDTGRGRSRLHAPGARRGTWSRVSRITPWAKGRRQTTAPPRDPPHFHLF